MSGGRKRTGDAPPPLKRSVAAVDLLGDCRTLRETYRAYVSKGYPLDPKDEAGFAVIDSVCVSVALDDAEQIPDGDDIDAVLSMPLAWHVDNVYARSTVERMRASLERNWPLAPYRSEFSVAFDELVEGISNALRAAAAAARP